MRVVSNEDQQNASDYSMKGFFIGMAQWAGVGLFASGIAYSFFPWYRKTQTVNKFYLVMLFSLGGGAYKSDRYMVQYERRGRSALLDETTRKKYELIHGALSEPLEEPKKVI
ncbi:hypothetical protein BDF14DRAFT_1721751 [Spinellus fusiger]|nr:hypothetical protein BDF14DRAFT_1721751 [Spinellus fusiger]